MLEGIFGGRTAERVLLYMQAYGEGHASGIAACFDIPYSAVYRQLVRFERSGALVSRVRGRTRTFQWSPRYYFRRELRALLRRALDALPESQRERYFRERTRPRWTGKPL